MPFSLWCLLAPAVDVKRHVTGGNAGTAPVVSAAAADSAAAALPCPAQQQEEKEEEEKEAGLCPSQSQEAASSEAGMEAGGAPGQDPPAAGLARHTSTVHLLQQASPGLGVEPAQLSAALPPRRRSRLSRMRAAGATVLHDLRQLSRHPVCLCVIGGLTLWNGFVQAYG